MCVCMYSYYSYSRDNKKTKGNVDVDEKKLNKREMVHFLYNCHVYIHTGEDRITNYEHENQGEIVRITRKMRKMYSANVHVRKCQGQEAST